MSRIIDILNAIISGDTYSPEVFSRAEAILKSIANNTPYTGAAIGRYEELLLAVKNGTPTDMIPRTRIDEILVAIANGTLESWLVGKNIFNINIPTNLLNCRKTIDENTIIFHPTGAPGLFSFQKMRITQGHTYTISCNDISYTSIGLFVSNEESQDSMNYGRITTDAKVLVFTATTDYLYVRGYSNYVTTTTPIVIKELKLEVGSTATPYTPYAFQSVLEEKLYEALGG